jgi:hypothetical protein
MDVEAEARKEPVSDEASIAQLRYDHPALTGLIR